MTERDESRSGDLGAGALTEPDAPRDPEAGGPGDVVQAVADFVDDLVEDWGDGGGDDRADEGGDDPS